MIPQYFIITNKGKESEKEYTYTCVLSHFSHIQLFATLWMVARHAPLSMRFSRQEYRSGLQSPPPGDLPYPGIKPMSLTSPALAGGFFTTSTTWEAHIYLLSIRTLTTSCEELTRWKRLWCWEGLEAGEGDDRGWDGWMASLIRWTWTLGDGDGQGVLACCNSWGRKELDTTEWLNSIYIYTYINHIYRIILLYTWN